MNEVKTFTMDGMKTFQIGDQFFIGETGGAQRVYGEHAELTKITKLHLVFKTDTDQIVKAKISNLNELVGKISKNTFISTVLREEGTFIKRSIHA